jgi:hypothetical protein
MLVHQDTAQPPGHVPGLPNHCPSDSFSRSLPVLSRSHRRSDSAHVVGIPWRIYLAARREDSKRAENETDAISGHRAWRECRTRKPPQLAAGHNFALMSVRRCRVLSTGLWVVMRSRHWRRGHSFPSTFHLDLKLTEPPKSMHARAALLRRQWKDRQPDPRVTDRGRSVVTE